MQGNTIRSLAPLALCVLVAACNNATDGHSRHRDPDAAAQTAQSAPDAIPAPADVAAPPADATVLPDGLAYKVLKAGEGDAHPAQNAVITVHYTGWTTDGKMFDSSVVRNEPATFPLNKLIPGWQEGIPLMTKGEKARFWIPGDLAYAGRKDRPDAPKGTLVFDVTLLDFKSP